MLAAWFTFLSIICLIVILFLKAGFLAKQWPQNKTFLGASFEMIISVISLVFLMGITVRNAYAGSIDALLLPNVVESSFYLTFAGYVFWIIAFFFVLETFIIFSRDLFASRRPFMQSPKRSGRMQSQQ